VEAAIKADSAGVAAELEVDGSVFRGGDAGIEAGELADFVRVAPGLMMAPTGTLDLEIEASAILAGHEFGAPIAPDGVVREAAARVDGQCRRKKHHHAEHHHGFTHGNHLRTCEDVQGEVLFHAE